MAGRHAYWVIVTGQDATAFRARYAEDLLPTLKQLQRTQPDAVLKWFERSRLWNSAEEAAAALKAPRRPAGPSRGREWRPGGEHRDPRAKFQLTRDEKRARFKKRRAFKARPDGPGKRVSGSRPTGNRGRPKRRG
jgi:hypothetical protein